MVTMSRTLPTADSRELGSLIARARQEQRLSQPEMARRLGISKGHLGLIELGERRPSRKLALLIADALLLPADKVLVLADHAEPPKGEQVVTLPADVASVVTRMVRRGWTADFLAKLEEVGMRFWLEPGADGLPEDDGDEGDSDVGEDDSPDEHPGPR